MTICQFFWNYFIAKCEYDFLFDSFATIAVFYNELCQIIRRLNLVICWMMEDIGRYEWSSFLCIYYSNWLESYKQIDTNYTDYLREKTERSSRTNFFVVIGKRSFLPPTTIGWNIFWRSILILFHYILTRLFFAFASVW